LYLLRFAWLWIVALCVLLIGLDAVTLWYDRVAQLRQAATDNANLAQSLARHAEGAFRLADAFVLEARDLAETAGISQTREQLDARMADRVARARLLRFLFVADEAGQVVASSAAVPPDGVAVADREYFTRLRTSTDRAAVIGTLDRSRLDRSWSIRLARRVNRPDGSFAGIVVATIDLDFFQAYYHMFDIGPGGSILLLTVGGRLLAREPLPEAMVGVVRPDVPLIRTYLPHSPIGTFEETSSIDGTRRLLSYQRLEGFPLLVAVGRSMDGNLAHWRWEVWTHAASVAAMILAIVLFGRKLTSQLHERALIERARDRLAAEHRLLTENSTDVVGRLGPDLVRLYLSPSCRQVFGWEPQELVGRTPEVTTLPEDWPACEKTLRALLDPAGPPSATFQYRGLRHDGTTVWLEESGKRIIMPDGDPAGLVVTCRDISLRKSIETRLEELIRQDALTGLTNRRGFDEQLDEEFRRARRSAGFVSLLMIDVDYFKPFNDTYGHQAGDACLRAIGAVLDRTGRRPGDHPARYGGEEFVMILQDTDINGALLVAEKIFAGVEALHIVHTGSHFGTVTVSLGVASVWVRDGATPEELVNAADAALYAAKHGGRNTIRSASGQFAAAKSDRRGATEAQPAACQSGAEPPNMRCSSPDHSTVPSTPTPHAAPIPFTHNPSGATAR
jgi:diguanylate cyclase (GGDEF)-like protein/PAS domain S-box-containing protein